MKNLKIKMKNDNVKFKIIFFGLCLFFIWFSCAKASTVYIIPQYQNIYEGDTFLADVQIDTEQESINALEGTVIFPENKLAAIDIIKGDSIIGLWIKEPNYSSKKGEISFAGGMPKGFSGQGSLFKIIFKVSDGGGSTAEVFIKDNLRVLLNDGKATAAKVKFLSGSYRIVGRSAGLPAVSSSSHPDSDKWHNNDTLRLHWALKDNSEYSYILSLDSVVETDEIPDKPEGNLVWMGDIKYEGLSDGIYYFHLKEKPIGGNWSRDAVFRAMIDKTLPEKLTAEIAEIEGKKYAVFSAQDLASGIERYEISESGNNGYFNNFFKKENIWKNAINPYLLEDQALSENIKIKAIDKAGNEKIIEIIPKPQKFYYEIAILILAALIILFWFALKKFIRFKHGKV